MKNTADNSGLFFRRDHIINHGQESCGLAVMFLLRCVCKQTELSAPTLAVDVVCGELRHFAICSRARRISDRFLHFGSIAEGANELQGQNGGTPFRIHRREFLVIGQPIDKIPIRKRSKESVVELMLEEPSKYRASTGQHSCNEMSIRAIEPVVVQHVDVNQREWRDQLQKRGRITALR